MKPYLLTRLRTDGAWRLPDGTEVNLLAGKAPANGNWSPFGKPKAKRTRK